MSSVVGSRRIAAGRGRSAPDRPVEIRVAGREPTRLDLDDLPAELLERLIEVVDQAERLDDPEDR